MMLRYKNVILDIYSSNKLKDIAFSVYEHIGVCASVMQEITDFFVVEEFNIAVLKARDTLFKKVPDISHNSLISAFKNSEQETANVIHHHLNGAVNIADIGFGRGFMLAELQRLMPNSNFLGTDITFKYRQIVHPGIKYILSDSSGVLPFLPDSLNAAIAIDVFHHINDDALKSLLASVSESLHSDGIFVFVDNTYCPNESVKFKASFSKLSEMQKKLLYSYTEIISHFIIAKTDMLLELNLKTHKEWVSFFEPFLLQCIYKEPLQIFPHKLHSLPKGMIIFKKVNKL